MKSTSNMRVLLIAALAASASAATTPCGGTCVETIFNEMVGAEAMGFKEADAATYGYLLWRGYTEGGGATGLGWVKGAVTWIGGADACDCKDACTAAKITTCIKDATAEKTKEIDDGITAYSGEGSSDELKKAFREILGAIANQVAPGSEPAKTWNKALTNEELTSAIKVYNVVGAYVKYVEPALAAGFAGKPTELAACEAAINTAISWSEGEDLALAIVNNGEKAFGKDGIQGDKCFGGSDALAAFEFTTKDGEKVKIDADNTFNAAVTKKKEAVDTTVAAQLKSTGADGSSDGSSPAAVLSAAAALIAMML